MSEFAVELRQVSKSFDDGRSWALAGLDLEVRLGELLVLVGQSGSGKTTALRLVNRLTDATHGTVRVEGRDVRDVEAHELRRQIGYVIQDDGLMPHMSIAENVALVPRLLGWPLERRRQRGAEVLELVGLDAAEFSARFPHSLSGGQRQRVGIARAIAAAPRIVLMDEPFGALDPLTRESLRSDFRRWQRAHGWSVVLVTHDIAEALLVADRIALLRDARVTAVGKVVELLASDDDYVRSMLETPMRQAEMIAALARRARSEGRSP